MFISGRGRLMAGIRVMLVATFMLHRFHTILSPHGYIWLVMAWTVMCAALASTDTKDPGEELRSRGL